MSKKQIKEKLREYKHMMFITRPLRGYLGNQYSYWEGLYNQLKFQN